HGMNAADVVVPQLGETEEDFNLFFNAFIEEFNPQGAVQLLMVEQYVYDQWRLRRFRRAETGFSAQAAARGEDCRITLRCGPDNEKNPYNYNGYTRLGINRTWSTECARAPSITTSTRSSCATKCASASPPPRP
ncbi:MAG: hypothetical protein JNN08_00935, partial [Bryobacterales bacterium]|nr:hypothetical protein [Bryobacterales bacterium]